MENDERKSLKGKSEVLEENNQNTDIKSTKEEINSKEIEENIKEKKDLEKNRRKEEKKALKKIKKAKREEKRKNRSTFIKLFIGFFKIILILVVACGIFVLGYATRGLHPLEIYPLSLFNNEPNMLLDTNVPDSVSRTDYGIIKNAGESTPIVTLSEHVKIEEVPYKFDVKAPDSAGNVYMNTTYTNNSKYVVKSYKLTLLLKDSNEKVYVISDDTVPVGSTSPNIESFGPKSQKVEDVEVLKYEIVAIGQNNNDVKITYDVKLGKYTVK